MGIHKHLARTEKGSQFCVLMIHLYPKRTKPVLTFKKLQNRCVNLLTALRGKFWNLLEVTNYKRPTAPIKFFADVPSTLGMKDTTPNKCHLEHGSSRETLKLHYHFPTVPLRSLTCNKLLNIPATAAASKQQRRTELFQRMFLVSCWKNFLIRRFHGEKHKTSVVQQYPLPYVWADVADNSVHYSQKGRRQKRNRVATICQEIKKRHMLFVPIVERKSQIISW